MLIRNKFAFYHIPRTGGESVEHVLQFNKQLEHPGWMRLGHKHELLRNQPLDIESYDIFTNIRNPFHRLVSLYELARSGGIYDIKLDKSVKFDEFVYDHWHRNPNDNKEYNTIEEHLFIKGELPKNVTLIKMEEMNQRWPGILKDYFGVQGIKMLHINSVPHGDPMTYYNRDLTNFIKKREEWALQFYS